MIPIHIQIRRKEYDDFLRRWIADVSFAIEGHDQPYLVTLVSNDGEQWRSNGVRFCPEPGEQPSALEGPVGEDDDNDIGWQYIEGDEKELSAVVDALQDSGFRAMLTGHIPKD